MSISSSFQVAASAIDSFSVGVSATAHNVANVNTADFDPVTVRYQSGAADRGVDAYVSSNNLEDQADMAFLKASEAEKLPDSAIPELFNPSKTDLSHEFTDLIIAKSVIGANAKVITVANNMMGTILDIKA